MSTARRTVLIALAAFLAAVGGVFVGRTLLPAPAQAGSELHDVLHHRLALDANQTARLDILEQRFAIQRRAIDWSCVPTMRVSLKRSKPSMVTGHG